jgi:hypothetical protein
MESRLCLGAISFNNKHLLLLRNGFLPNRLLDLKRDLIEQDKFLELPAGDVVQCLGFGDQA